MTALPVCDHDECNNGDFCNHWTIEQAFNYGKLDGQRRTYTQAFAAGRRQGHKEGMTEAAGIVEQRISFIENREPAQVNNQIDRRQITEAILAARDAKP